MPISVATTRQALADAYKALGDRVSLHTGDPGTTGANEASGGSPAYARQTTVWSSGTGGVLTATEVTFDVPAGTYTHTGIRSSGGTFIDGKPLTTPITLGAQGQVKVTPSFVQS